MFSFSFVKMLFLKQEKWSTSTNLFCTMEIIILMNKYIQICIKGHGQVNVSVLFSSNAFLKTKRGGPLALIGFSQWK